MEANKKPNWGVTESQEVMVWLEMSMWLASEATQGLIAPVLGQRFRRRQGGLLMILAKEEVEQNRGAWVRATKVLAEVAVGTQGGHFKGSWLWKRRGL